MAPPRGPRRVLWVGERHHIGELCRVGVHAACDQPRDVGRVEHQQRPGLVGYLPQRLGLDHSGVGGGAGHDQLGMLGQGQVAQLVEVDALVAGGNPVGHEPVLQAREVHRRPVGEVPAVVEAHAQHGVARLDEGLVGAHVGDGSGVGLHVGVVGPEQLAGSAAGQVLDLVDHHVAAVVAPAGVALAVLVGEHRAGGGHYRRAGEVLRGDELDGWCSGGESPHGSGRTRPRQRWARTLVPRFSSARAARRGRFIER